jgi:signal transduction histidine kinase
MKRLSLTVIIFFILLGFCSVFIYVVEQKNISSLRKKITEIGSTQARALSRQLERSLSATYALASILRKGDRISEFDSLAEDMISRYGGISSLQLAPGGVVSRIFPLKGNEAAIGHDLLNDPKRRTEALAAIKSRKLTIAGPFDLVQGGVGIIGRYPVFLFDKETGKEYFWGFTIALIKFEKLLHASNFNYLIERDSDYKLSRIDPDTNKRHFFAESGKKPLDNPVTINFEVPNGEWHLSISPKKGWFSPLELLFYVSLSITVSLLVSVSFFQRSKYIEKLSETKKVLEKEIGERKKLEQALLEIEEGELRRIGYDLHDDLGQQLTGIALKISSLEHQLKNNVQIATEDIVRIKSLIVNAITQIKNLSMGLSPLVEEGEESLMIAIEQLAANTQKLFQVPCVMRYDQPVSINNESAAIQLYRIAQEAITNAVKHARPGQIEVRLGKSGNEITMTVKDDGVGISENPEEKSGIGFQIMKHRADMIGATLDIQSEINKGTIVTCTFPDDPFEKSTVNDSE